MTPISTSQINQYIADVKAGGINTARDVYTDLKDLGFGYAGWALGVANGTTITGQAALDYLQATAVMGIGERGSQNVTTQHIDQIRIDMLLGYLDTLRMIGNQNGGTIDRDVRFSETRDFHIQAFEKNNLTIENWTLEVPMELIRRSQGDSAAEAAWVRIRDTGGEGIDALLASTGLAQAVGRAAFSNDPAIRTRAREWIDVVPGVANFEQIGRLANAIIESRRSDPAYGQGQGDPFTGLLWPGTDISHADISTSGERTTSSTAADGTITQTTKDALGNIIETATFEKNGLGWNVTVRDYLGEIVEGYYQRPPASSSSSASYNSHFQDRYEQEDITEAMDRVANLTEADIREIAAYEGLASLTAGATLNLDFSNFGSEVISADEYTISVPSLANMVRAGMTVQEAVTSTLMGQFGTSLLASGFFGEAAEFDSTSFTNAIDNNNLSGFMDGLSQLEARSYLAQYFIKDSLGLDVPIFNSEGVDLTASLNELIPGSAEIMPSSVDDILAAFSAELRASMDEDKSGLMLNGSRDAFSDYRSQLTAEFKYLPLEIMLAMADPYETDFFPSNSELMQDADDADLEHQAVMDYRVFVDGVFRDAGQAFCTQLPTTNGQYHVGLNEINRLTVFVNGDLYIDGYFDLSRYPVYAIGAQAVYSYNISGAHMYGSWWDLTPPPGFHYQSLSSAHSSDDDILSSSPTHSSATLLVQAMSEMGSAGTAPSFNVVRKVEPPLLAAH